VPIKTPPNQEYDITKGMRWLRWCKGCGVVALSIVTIIPYELIPDSIIIGIILTVAGQTFVAVAFYIMFRGWVPRAVHTFGASLVHDGLYQTMSGNHATNMAIFIGVTNTCIAIVFCIGHMWFDQRIVGLLVAGIMVSCAVVAAIISMQRKAPYTPLPEPYVTPQPKPSAPTYIVGGWNPTK
jgi:hypothetical protein